MTPRYWKTTAEVHATRRWHWLATGLAFLILADTVLQRRADKRELRKLGLLRVWLKRMGDEYVEAV